MTDELAIFTDRIRKVWHNEDWWFSVVDVVGVLSDAPVPRNYWADMKRKVQAEGFVEVLEKVQQLKMLASDGKMRTTDVADTETILRIIQSIPSPKAEPFKRWLAKVGTERIQEDAQPADGVERLIGKYRKMGYSDEWITQRVRGLVYRSEVVSEWAQRGADSGTQIAKLTDTLSVGAFGITTRQHKTYKGVPASADLRDSQTTLELAVTGVAEATAAAMHRKRNTQGFQRLKSDCVDAGDVAKETRERIESALGEPVLSETNYKELQKERQRELQPGLFPEQE
jgi:hypothetical protein